VSQGRAQYLVFANTSGVAGRRLTGEINWGIPDPSVRVVQVDTSFDNYQTPGAMTVRLVVGQVGYFIAVPRGNYMFTIRLQETGPGLSTPTVFNVDVTVVVP
jgi:hypothetical protein